jgi:hypothetical protein
VRSNAEWLRKHLKAGLAIDTRVVPIIAIPGWFVPESEDDEDVIVANAKMLPGSVRRACRGSLNPREEKLIYLHLAGFCRDVEFYDVC